jgi:phage gp46-like protein
MTDINILGSDVERDPGLETSILISLFSDRRADDQDTLPDNSGDKRGWWGDTEQLKVGSKLWLLHRSSLTPDVPGVVTQYIEDALQWMIDDGVIKGVDVEVVREDAYTLSTTIGVQQPDGQEKFYKYSFNWNAEILKRG